MYRVTWLRSMAAVAAVLGAAGFVAAQAPPEAGGQDTAAAEPGQLVPPRSPSGWYTTAEMEHAAQSAVTLGLPMAVMLTDPNSSCPKCRVKTQEFMRARELSPFVRVLVSTQDGAAPALLAKLRQEAGNRAGRFIPMLFLGTSKGEYLGVIPYESDRPQLVNAVGVALTQFGGVVPPDQMMGLWKKLANARRFWSEGKTMPALRAYQDIKRAEAVNPRLAIFAELQRDEPQIVARGEEDLEAVRQLLAAGDHRKARVELATIRRQYMGFQTAEDAKALQEAKPAPDAAAGAPQAGAGASDSLRTWTDATGEHRIEAKLVDVRKGWVQLQRDSGKLVSLPIARLSEPDQQYVARWESERDAGESP